VRQINPNIYPNGGYRFTEQDGSVHVDESWRKLEAKVVDYRQRNGFPAGDVWNEMMAQVCGSAPGLCGDYSGDTVPQSSGAGSDFSHRIMEWLAWAVGQKRLNAWHRVSDEEAARRATICSACPKQRGLNTTCGTCLNTIAGAREALGGSRHQNLHPCGVLNEDCQATVHGTQAPSNNPELPAECWRRA
jgi:hypothetical protein